jgi:hypothetical protein
VTVAADPYPILGRVALGYVLLGGPLAWALHLLISYGPVEIACSATVPLFLHGVTLTTALVALGAALLGWRTWSRARRTVPPADDGDALRRTRFVAACGTILGGFFVLVIVLEGIPVLLVDPCMRAS